MNFELVIFDCDGVLVDSEPIANRVLVKILSDAGLHMPAEQVMEAFVGRSAATCLTMIEQRIGRSLPSNFLEEWDRVLFEAIARDVTPIPGVVVALEKLTVPVCVASSGSHERMRVSLGATGLSERFEGRLFSSTDVSRGKPFPDLFLHAARTLGAAPQRCAVIEDTPVGVSAGVAAGMAVLGYAAGAHSDPQQLQAAGATVFFDMDTLPELLDLGDRCRGGSAA